MKIQQKCSRENNTKRRASGHVPNLLENNTKVKNILKFARSQKKHL